MSRPTTTQVKVTSSNQKKLENGSVIIKNCIQRQETSSKNPTLSRSKPPISHNSNARTRNNSARKAKTLTESLPTTSIAENLRCKDGPKKINQTGQMEFVSTLTSVSRNRNDNLPATDSAETEKFDIEDKGDAVCRSSLSEVSSQISQLDNGIQFAVEKEQIGDRKTELHIKALLLSSPSFLECPEDLFDLHMNQPIVHETTNVTDKLYLDYANELIERKGYQTSVTGHPLLHTYIDYPRIKFPLDQLIEEVCDGVDSLRSYTKVTDNVDGIYKVLESDVKWKGMMVGGVWDLAWANGFSVNEVDQVVCEVENYVLTGLIEEIIEDISKSLVQDL